MLRLLADENFNGIIVSGLLKRQPDLDIVRVQDVGLLGAEDPVILGWAAREDRVLLTHDAKTITKYAYERVLAGQRMPGVFELVRTLPISRAIDEILLVALASHEGEWEGQVRYLPL
jgi:predicted nuclease of predicted toxin-antitoxin system